MQKQTLFLSISTNCVYQGWKSGSRKYLNADLSVRKLHRIYNAQATEDLQVKLSYFFYVFKTKFNLGFGHPAKDACSYCIQLKRQIKNAPSEQERNTLMAQKAIHRLRKNAFFELVKEKEDHIVIYYIFFGRGRLYLPPLYQPRRPKLIRDRIDYVNILSDNQFFSRFRLTKVTVLQLLGMIEEDITPRLNR